MDRTQPSIYSHIMPFDIQWWPWPSTSDLILVCNMSTSCPIYFGLVILKSINEMTKLLDHFNKNDKVRDKTRQDKWIYWHYRPDQRGIRSISGGGQNDIRFKHDTVYACENWLCFKSKQTVFLATKYQMVQIKILAWLNDRRALVSLGTSS